ncbi:MAG: dihydrofolate reductase [SAR86 cluster bacterium]|nr:dihydrofolate reductase [SAR86 cluster bacterium]
MNFTIIAAVSNNQVIGSSGRIPWSIPEDLKHFKKQTLGSIVVMGRKTYESIGRPLPDRTNIVITSSLEKIDGVLIFKSIKDFIATIDGDKKEIFIIGGQKIYEAFLPLSNKLIITEVNLDIEGDTFFPFWPQSEWREISRQEQQDMKSEFKYNFVTLEKII